MRWSSIRANFAFVRHVPLRQLNRRLFLVARRNLAQRFRSQLDASPARLLSDAPQAPFPPRTESAWHGPDGWRFRFLARECACGPLIDWHLGGPGDANQLWTMNLHYFEWSEELDDAAFMDAVDQWIAANPPFAPGADRDAWNAYALSLRCVVMLQQLVGRPLLDAAWKARVAQEVARQLNFLERHLETDIGGNHLIKNIVALLWGASAIASDDAPRWRRTGLALLDSALDQILPDGMHFERSPSYHPQVLADLIAIRHALREDPFGGRLDNAIDRAAHVVADLAHPDGGAGLGMARSPGECVKAVAALTGLRVTPRRAFDLEDGGYAGLRSGNDLLLVDAGPLCPDALPSHAHGDIGSIEWSVAGDRIIVDQGVFEYVVGVRRQQSRSAAFHNTLAAAGCGPGRLLRRLPPRKRARIARREVDFVDGGMRLIVAHDGFVGLNGAARPDRLQRAV